MHRSLKVVTAATAPLFTTAEAKDFLKVDTTADDTLIDNLVAAATESCQIYTNQYFINTVVSQHADNWSGTTTLYKSPVHTFTEIAYLDSVGAEQTWNAAEYIVDKISHPARIELSSTGSGYPTILGEINVITIKYTVGYGTSSDDVPDGIKSAVLITLANLYENRQSVITGRTATELPLSSQYLLDQYKIQVC